MLLIDYILLAAFGVSVAVGFFRGFFREAFSLLVWAAAIYAAWRLGEYPDDLTDDSDVNMGRGRIVPTRSWDAMWHSIAKWFGVEDTNLASVLPNMDNFKPPKASQNLLFSKSDLFK